MTLPPGFRAFGSKVKGTWSPKPYKREADDPVTIGSLVNTRKLETGRRTFSAGIPYT